MIHSVCQLEQACVRLSQSGLSFLGHLSFSANGVRAAQAAGAQSWEALLPLEQSLAQLDKSTRHMSSSNPGTAFWTHAELLLAVLVFVKAWQPTFLWCWTRSSLYLLQFLGIFLCHFQNGGALWWRNAKQWKAFILSCEDSISRGAAVKAEGQKNHIKRRRQVHVLWWFTALCIHCKMTLQPL